MVRKLFASTIAIFALLATIAIPVFADGPPTPDIPGFDVTILATGLDQPKGLVSALHRAGDGQFGNDLYVAVSGSGQIVRVDKGGAGVTDVSDVSPFPVGVSFFGGPFGKFLYVGKAGVGGGLVKIDLNGDVLPFAPDLDEKRIAGLDFGRGAYGPYLYAGEWQAGNIWKVDSAGNADLFASIEGNQTRYLKFSHGNGFGTILYFTNYPTGDIYQVDPGGAETLFASTGSLGLEGFDFSPGGAFGHFLYAGNLQTGEIYQVAPDGTVVLWASGFNGVADIYFEPGGRGGFTMYIVDGKNDGTVYAISKT